MSQITAAMVAELRAKTGAGMMDCKKALVETAGDVEAAIEFLRKKGLAAAAKKAGRIAAEGLVMAVIEGENGAMVEVNCETDFVAKNEDFRGFVRNVTSLVLEKQPADVDALLSLPMADSTVGNVLKGLIAKIGENQSVRRFARFQGGVVHKYIHGGGDMGRVGVMVQLEGPANEAARELANELCLQIAFSKPPYLRREEVPADTLVKEREIEREKAIAEGKKPEVADKIVEGKINNFYKQVALLEQEWVRDNKKRISDVIKDYSAKAGGALTVKAFVRYEVGEGVEKKADDFEEEVRKMAGG